MEKSSNMGVREVVCRTILENRLSIICLQEVYELAAMQMICDELNSPKLRRCNDWKDNSRQWKFITNISDADSICVNGLAILYDASRCELLKGECFEIQLANCESDEVCILAPQNKNYFLLSDIYSLPLSFRHTVYRQQLFCPHSNLLIGNVPY